MESPSSRYLLCPKAIPLLSLSSLSLVTKSSKSTRLSSLCHDFEFHQQCGTYSSYSVILLSSSFHCLVTKSSNSTNFPSQDNVDHCDWLILFLIDLLFDWLIDLLFNWFLQGRCASPSPLVWSSFTEPSSSRRRFEPRELDRPPLSAGFIIVVIVVMVVSVVSVVIMVNIFNITFLRFGGMFAPWVEQAGRAYQMPQLTVTGWLYQDMMVLAMAKPRWLWSIYWISFQCLGFVLSLVLLSLSGFQRPRAGQHHTYSDAGDPASYIHSTQFSRSGFMWTFHVTLHRAVQTHFQSCHLCREVPYTVQQLVLY